MIDKFGKLYKSRSWLEYRFEELKERMNDVAKICNCSPETIRYWMKKLGVKIRNKSEARRLISRHVNLTRGLVEFLTGLLLGDGHLGTTNRWTGQYEEGSKYKSYLEWSSNRFGEYGVKQVGKIHRQESWHTMPGCRDKLFHDISYNYASKRYVELALLHKQWYRKAREDERWSTGRQKKWIKIVPSNLKLSPLTCLMWYLGDGNINKVNRNSSISTKGFTVREVDFLVEKLNREGFEAVSRKDKGIFFTVTSTKDFLEYVGKCPVKCYEYKWEIKKYKRRPSKVRRI